MRSLSSPMFDLPNQCETLIYHQPWLLPTYRTDCLLLIANDHLNAMFAIITVHLQNIGHIFIQILFFFHRLWLFQETHFTSKRLLFISLCELWCRDFCDWFWFSCCLKLYSYWRTALNYPRLYNNTFDFATFIFFHLCHFLGTFSPLLWLSAVIFFFLHFYFYSFVYLLVFPWDTDHLCEPTQVVYED